MFKECSKCKKKKSIKNFYPDENGKDGYRSQCKKCFSEYAISYQGVNGNKYIKKYHKSEKGKKSINKASRKSYINNKEKWITRAKTHLAIKNGIIIKPNKCEVCEKKVSGHALQAHHIDYTKPLEVIFLCYSCHAEADKLLN
jgi:DNA-directed RNA polymerase subunit M/transcription elongation factor TFIIS